MSDMELNQQQEIKNTQRTYNTLVLCELRIRFEGPKRVSLLKIDFLHADKIVFDRSRSKMLDQTFPKYELFNIRMSSL